MPLDLPVYIVLIIPKYARYLEQTHNPKIPASWTETAINSNGSVNGYSNGYVNGHINLHTPLSKSYLENKAVRTVYGPVPLKYALDWPVFASYDELAGCARWMGGRIPTLEQARSIYKYVDCLKIKEAEQHLGKFVPAVNGYVPEFVIAGLLLMQYRHLINNGVQESPPSEPLQNGGSSQELFTNLKDANVGFKNWHPISVTGNGKTLAGQSEMGGLWEWTSSNLTRHEGFEPMPLYPAYTGIICCDILSHCVGLTVGSRFL